MRQTLKTLCRISFSQAISEKALETLDQTVFVTAAHLYRTMFQKACIALKITPGSASKRDMANIDKALNKFVKELEWDEKRNIHVLLNFSLELLEELYNCTNDEYRRKSLDDLMKAEMNIYHLFDEPEKDEEYIAKGFEAVKRWKELIG